MEKPKQETSKIIKVTYYYKQKGYSFLIPEECCLYKHFVENDYIVTKDDKLLRMGTDRLDSLIKDLSQKDLAKQPDYKNDGHPMNITVCCDENPVYYIKDYFSDGDVIRIINNMV